MTNLNKFSGKLLFLLIVVFNFCQNCLALSRCQNPNKNYGYCISIYECHSLLGLVQGTLTELDKSFIRGSQCFSYGVQHPVCCTRDTGYLRKNRFDSTQKELQYLAFAFPSEKKALAPKELDIPRPPVCGGLTFQNKIYGGEETDLKEFSWMVLLEYKKKNGVITTSCSGSLINHRYILTAAHCVKGQIETKVGKLHSVRVGEYDLSKTRDCQYNECLNPATRYGIDEVIPHHNFDDNVLDRHNDIALIRLSRDVEYSDSVKPVCLPFIFENRHIPVGSNLTVAGWGQTEKVGKSSIKQKVNVPYYNFDECKRRFQTKAITIDSSQLCAGGNFGEDSCIGDSGGPLMLRNHGNWVLEGIVSFGYKCGLEGWPAVYAKVTSFENWIKSKLR